MIALDDDLWRHRSKKIIEDGVMQINNPAKGMGIVHHASVSVCTGLYCGGYVQQRDDTTEQCVTNVQKILCQAICDTKIELNGTIFFMDRGYGGTDGEIISLLIARGGHIHGTAKRMNSFPYTYDKPPKPNQVKVQEYDSYDVPLCRVSRRGNNTSCFHEWHTAKKLNTPCTLHGTLLLSYPTDKSELYEADKENMSNRCNKRRRTTM
jgi:hypothetical protein